MKLWLLRPAGFATPMRHPTWEPWYDKSFGFVVRAENERQARALASDFDGIPGDEGYGAGRGAETETASTPAAWSDPRFSTCVELSGDGECGIIMQDFRRA